MLGRTTLCAAVAMVCLVALPGAALAAPFLAGNPVVYTRTTTGGFVGDARPADLREYDDTTASQANPRQTIALTAPPGGFAGDAEGSAEYMTRSRNGRYLVVPGYGVTPTVVGGGVELPNPSGTDRMVALVDPAAAIEPHIVREVVDGALVGATSRDGDQAWMSDSSGAVTFRDLTVGGFTTVASNPDASLGQISMANAGDGGLFTSVLDISNSLVDIGPDIEDPGQTMTAVAGVDVDETFAFADVSTTTGGDDVLFTSSGTTVNKYSRSGSTWTARGTLSLATPLSSRAIQAIAAVVDPATPTIARVFVISTGAAGHVHHHGLRKPQRQHRHHARQRGGWDRVRRRGTGAAGQRGRALAEHHDARRGHRHRAAGHPHRRDGKPRVQRDPGVSTPRR